MFSTVRTASIRSFRGAIPSQTAPSSRESESKAFNLTAVPNPRNFLFDFFENVKYNNFQTSSKLA